MNRKARRAQTAKARKHAEFMNELRTFSDTDLAEAYEFFATHPIPPSFDPMRDRPPNLTDEDLHMVAEIGDYLAAWKSRQTQH